MISDGETSSSTGAIEIAERLKQSGVIIYTIQINQSINYPGEKEGDEVLKRISSGEGFHLYSSYEGLYETIKELEFCQ